MSGGGTRSGRRRTGGAGSTNSVLTIPLSEQMSKEAIHDMYNRVGMDISLDDAQEIKDALYGNSLKKYNNMLKGSEENDTVRGIPQTEIDKIKGTRGLMKKYSDWTWQVVQEDYKRIGINISKNEAKDIFYSLRAWNSPLYENMRSAEFKFRKGEKLNSEEYVHFTRFHNVMEYIKIAPTFADNKKSGFIYRGVKDDGSDYSQKILALKPGEKFDLSKIPSSFSTSLNIAHTFGVAQRDGKQQPSIIFKLPASRLKNSCAVPNPTEKEVLVSDYDFKVAKIEDKPYQKLITLM